jgi:putative transposase
MHGRPAVVRVDNGPEFTSNAFELWAKGRDITIQYIQPGKPTQNGYIERFNRVYREAVLDAYLFFDLYQVKQLTTEWMEECNERRSHEALNNLTPEEWKNSLSNNEITPP